MQRRVRHLYILAGQSNMDGMGFNADLPGQLNRVHNDVPIYNPNRRDDGQPVEDRGFWDSLQPGHGYEYRTDGERGFYSDRFGPELTFVQTLKEQRPDAPIALFKYAKPGASIHPHQYDDWGCWHPDHEGVNQWTHFEHHYRRAVSLFDSEDEVLRPEGILWLQGESDAAYTREIAEAYQANLARLMHCMRDLTGDMELPLVIGQIASGTLEDGSPSLPYASIVQQAQQDFVDRDDYAALVRLPKNHGWLDPWHYDSETYLELGRRFAAAVIELLVG